jgi:hypothetical protein
MPILHNFEVCVIADAHAVLERLYNKASIHRRFSKTYQVVDTKMPVLEKDSKRRLALLGSGAGSVQGLDFDYHV